MLEQVLQDAERMTEVDGAGSPPRRTVGAGDRTNEGRRTLEVVRGKVGHQGPQRAELAHVGFARRPSQRRVAVACGECGAKPDGVTQSGVLDPPDEIGLLRLGRSGPDGRRRPELRKRLTVAQIGHCKIRRISDFSSVPAAIAS
jgi:hypothetical protein